jgi:agmatine/peptidylarginine deiminase
MALNKTLKMKRIFLFLFALISYPMIAQDLPNGLTDEELRMLPTYRFPGQNNKAITSPPGGSIRAMAEWEEVSGLVISWRSSYASTLREIVRYGRLETRVIIICADSNAVKTSLTNANIPLSNITYLEEASNSVWMRDYGANPIYRNDVDSLFLVDWIYNRPRPDDDVVPSALGAYLNLPVYTTTAAPNDLVHTGGNYMSDGAGTAFSSKLVLDENGPAGTFNVTVKTEAEIDSIMKNFMGITRYIKMETLPYDGIHHIDMHMKLLDEETLLIGEYPAGVADGPQIEANLQYVLSNFNSMFGTPYKVIRVVMPPETNGSYPNTGGDYLTFTNSVFVNKTVLMPVYRPEFDTTALRIMKSALPGYNVVGINCNSIIQQSGAIHCITHTVGVSDPLRIVHQPLTDTYNTTNPYTVNGTFQHRSGISTAQLYFTTDTTQPYVVVPMTMTNPATNTWSGDIPAQVAGTEIFYYLEGTSNSGKIQVRPMPAPEGYWKFKVLDSTTSLNEKEISSFLNNPFPNPGRAITCIPFNNGVGGRVEVQLIDALGRSLQTIFEGNIEPGKKNFFVDCSQFEAGLYFVQVKNLQGQYTKPLMVK